MMNEVPRATYRLQLSRGFTFADAARLVPYLSSLGISHCYVSPILAAMPGSSHNYDIVDHQRLNPELGTREDFNLFSDALRQHGMGLIVDVVPNHMSIDGKDNAWWLDLLENGPSSRYASYFDIDWQPVARYLHGKILLPVLRGHYGKVLERNEIRLGYNEEEGSFFAQYFDHFFPIDPKTYPLILKIILEKLAKIPAAENALADNLKNMITAFASLPSRNRVSRKLKDQRRHEQEQYKRRLKHFLVEEASARLSLAMALEVFNRATTGHGSPTVLHRLLEKQAYRLAYWRVAADDINYRRFVDVNNLAGLRMELPEVFDQAHRLFFDLIAEGRIQGLRIDHIDGLFDPLAYLKRLVRGFPKKTLAPDETPEWTSRYVVVEKILTSFEYLSPEWPVAGTTGYDFTGLVNSFLVHAGGESGLNRTYRSFTGYKVSYEELVCSAKALIIGVQLSSELNVLANMLRNIAEGDLRSRDYTLNGLRQALFEIVVGFPVYRTYIDRDTVTEADRNYIAWSVARAKKMSPAADTSIFDFISDILLQAGREDGKRRGFASALRFAMKFQQYTAPVMVKAVEDTVFYRFNRLVSLNEVGGNPASFGLSMAAFHRANQQRYQHWHHSMLATSTHDSKRGEDVRARISILSEVPEQWQKQVWSWRKLNRIHRQKVGDAYAPDRNDEYLFYQTLVGTWPVTITELVLYHYRKRVEGYMIKALREAKVHSSWINPDSEYEQAVTRFVRSTLHFGSDNGFIKEFDAFQRKISRFGYLNSLTQTLLKLTVPGVPDFYQGNELWTFDLVDPDNRHPVDYRLYRDKFALLQSLVDTERSRLLHSLLESLDNGLMKMFMTWQLLKFRKERPHLFAEGDYQPLATEKPYSETLCVFARNYREQQMIVIVPRFFTKLWTGENTREENGQREGPRQQIKIQLPNTPSTPYHELFSAQSIFPVGTKLQSWIDATSVLSCFPFAVLVKLP